MYSCDRVGLFYRVHSVMYVTVSELRIRLTADNETFDCISAVSGSIAVACDKHRGGQANNPIDSPSERQYL